MKNSNGSVILIENNCLIRMAKWVEDVKWINDKWYLLSSLHSNIANIATIVSWNIKHRFNNTKFSNTKIKTKFLITFYPLELFVEKLFHSASKTSSRNRNDYLI